ncbi:MAG: hypothetical protein OEW65_11530, partial [Thermoleophilia bacterium]|nr:hypothetical protein [Thermoleophilia bacterium]
MNSPRVWISAEEPDETALRLAVERAGGTVAISSADADAVVWARDERGLIRDHLTECIRWVQVWDAGVDEWLSLDVVDSTRAWTCAKGLYAVPIGEYCLAALLSCARALPRQVSCSTWRPPPVASLG